MRLSLVFAWVLSCASAAMLGVFFGGQRCVEIDALRSGVRALSSFREISRAFVHIASCSDRDRARSLRTRVGGLWRATCVAMAMHGAGGCARRYT
jgi:hypothetical protein